MNMELLKTLLTAYGATSREGCVREVIKSAIVDYVDSMTTDAMGNLIAVKKGSGAGKRIMVSAHMDHIGLMVMDADENGFLRVYNVGTLHTDNIVAQHVVFENGVMGVVNADQGVKGELEVGHLYIDVGAESREEALALAPVGSIAVTAPRVTMLGKHRIASPALDDRIACWALVETLRALPADMDNEVIAVFTAQEEVGLRGATVAAFAVQPDMGIALDVTGLGDIPGHKSHLPMALGKGAAVKIMDKSLFCTPSVVSLMVQCAEENGIPYQREVLPMARTEAGAMQKTQGGVPAGGISIPCRYMHSAAEVVDLRDAQAAQKLLAAVLMK